ncbi:hypothetical protein GGX14DRAFT_631564, partial [Mycena pura]
SLGLETVLTPELIATGELVSALKRVVNVLGSTFDSIGEQTERVASLAPTLKAAEQIKKLRADIAWQIHEHELCALEITNLLNEAVKQTLSEELKAHIHTTVEREVKGRLNVQIPEQLRDQIKSHKRQILEVRRGLHNSEARQYNSAIGPSALNEELRPLLRPLPTGEQSPMFGGVPPTPAATDGEANLGEPTATPSAMFPRDLKALFTLKSEEAETLVKEYGIGDLALPVTPITTEGAGAEPDSHQRNLNKFMAHIGVRRQVPNPRLPRLHIVIPGGEEVAVTTYY